MAHLVPAVAQSRRQWLTRCATTWLARSQSSTSSDVLVGERLLVDEDPSELGLSPREEGANEVLFDVQVLVEELGEHLLVDVASHPHHRELEEAGHRRRQDPARLPVAHDVDEQGLRGERLENVPRLGGGRVPGARGRLGPERANRQGRHERGLALGEEHLQDAVEKVGRRRALREPIEPVDQAAVAGAGGCVRHRSLPLKARGLRRCANDSFGSRPGGTRFPPAVRCTLPSTRVTLSAGTKLGPYEILAPLGAGGMGEVYRARDTRLERDGRGQGAAAAPVLVARDAPAVRARGEDDLELSHPHICTLYDVGREGERDYLVMELLEGETLADRLAKGPLPLEQTLRFGARSPTRSTRRTGRGSCTGT